MGLLIGAYAENGWELLGANRWAGEGHGELEGADRLVRAAGSCGEQTDGLVRAHAAFPSLYSHLPSLLKNPFFPLRKHRPHRPSWAACDLRMGL